MSRVLAAAAVAALVLGAAPAFAQQVSLEDGMRAAGLWCFPLAADPRQYGTCPIPSTWPATSPDGRSSLFVRYVINAPHEGEASVTAADGGGIVHFLVALDAPPAATLRAAEQELQRERRDAQIALRGPMVFREGATRWCHRSWARRAGPSGS